MLFNLCELLIMCDPNSNKLSKNWHKDITTPPKTNEWKIFVKGAKVISSYLREYVSVSKFIQRQEE